MALLMSCPWIRL